ncbi:MAG: hypothetical protein ABIH66_00535 [bacterium]
MKKLVVFGLILTMWAASALADECKDYCDPKYEYQEEYDACLDGCRFGLGVESEKNEATVTPTREPSDPDCETDQSLEMGAAKGTITYQYNQYFKYVGTKPDVGATVYFFPKCAIGKIPDTTDSRKNEWIEPHGVFSATVNGIGEYSITELPAGEYNVLIVSKNSTRGSFFEMCKSKGCDLWRRVDASDRENFFGKYFENKEDAFRFILGAGKYKIENTIKVIPNKTIDISWESDFTNTSF